MKKYLCVAGAACVVLFLCLCAYRIYHLELNAKLENEKNKSEFYRLEQRITSVELGISALLNETTNHGNRLSAMADGVLENRNVIGSAMNKIAELDKKLYFTNERISLSREHQVKMFEIYNNENLDQNIKISALGEAVFGSGGIPAVVVDGNLRERVRAVEFSLAWITEKAQGEQK